MWKVWKKIRKMEDRVNLTRGDKLVTTKIVSNIFFGETNLFLKLIFTNNLIKLLVQKTFCVDSDCSKMHTLTYTWKVIFKPFGEVRSKNFSAVPNHGWHRYRQRQDKRERKGKRTKSERTRRELKSKGKICCGGSETGRRKKKKEKVLQ